MHAYPTLRYCTGQFVYSGLVVLFHFINLPIPYKWPLRYVIAQDVRGLHCCFLIKNTGDVAHLTNDLHL